MAQIMAADDNHRNFRSGYYEKVGFRNVEEKKSLEILLREKPLDKQKLRQFCLRFATPGLYRNLIWKILLGVLPIYEDSHEFVMSQRHQEYKDLERGLKIMRIIDQNTTKPQVFFAMWSLEYEQLNYDFNINLEHEVVAISRALSQIFNSDVDVYWLTKGIYSFVLTYQNDMTDLAVKVRAFLERDDPLLYEHLQKLNAIKSLPLDAWFKCLFAGYLSETYLVKIWDKVCAGSLRILAYVAFAYLITYRNALLRCSNANDVFHCLSNMNEKTAETIVNQAIELWSQNGYGLTGHHDMGKIRS